MPYIKNRPVTSCIILGDICLFFLFLTCIRHVRGPWRHQPEKPFHPCLHRTITTLGHHCRICLLGSSPSGQKANRTKSLQWQKKKTWQLPHWNVAVAIWSKGSTDNVSAMTCVSIGNTLTTFSVKLTVKYFQWKMPVLIIFVLFWLNWRMLKLIFLLNNGNKLQVQFSHINNRIKLYLSTNGF